MSSLRETAIAALQAAIATALASRNPAPSVIRNLDVPEAIPAGGAVVLRDGDSQIAETLLSPLRYVVEQTVEIEVAATGSTEAAGRALCDALLQAIAAAAIASRTLGGAVEWVEIAPPRLGQLAWEGAATSVDAAIAVTLTFTATAHPLA